MFYSVKLLSVRRNAKFAKCWLAANLSAKVFYNKFRRQTIAAISIPQTCGELIIYIKTDSSNRRFSLYLSSQLMFGVTRILYYQTDTFLKFQWELWISSNTGSRILDAEDGVRKKKRKKLPNLLVDGTLPEEPPAFVHTTRNRVPDERRITLPEADGIFVGGSEAMLRDPDYLNFGALTEEDLLRIIDPEGFRSEESTQVRALPEIVDNDEPPRLRVADERIQHEPLKNGTIDEGRIPDENGSLYRIPLPDPIEEPSLPGEPQLNVVEFPRTPMKRKLPHSPGSETPSKLRNLLDSQEKPAPPEVIPAPEDQPPETAAKQISNNELSLETLDSSNFVVRTTKKKPRRLIIDNKTRLPAAESHQLQTQTLSKVVPCSPKISAANMLKIPSTRLAGGNRSLLNNYREMLKKCKSPPDDDVHDSRKSGRPRQPKGAPELIRVPEPAERTAEISSNLMQTHTVTIVDGSKIDQSKLVDSISVDEKTHATPVKLPPLTGGPGDLAGPSDQLDTVDEVVLPEVDVDPPAPEVLNLSRTVRNVIRDWKENGKSEGSKSSVERSRPEKIVSCIDARTNGSRETSISRTSWVKSDILGMLEILWQQKRVVDFKDICLPLSSTRRDASQVFGILLELQKTMIVRLMQAAPYQKIYIQKYF